MITGVAESREGALAYVEKYQSAGMTDRAFDLAWTHSHVILRQINASEAEAQLYGASATRKRSNWSGSFFRRTPTGA